MPVPTYTADLLKDKEDLLDPSIVTIISGGNIFNGDHDEDLANISITTLNEELANLQTNTPSMDSIEFLPAATPEDLPFEHFKNTQQETAAT